MKAVIREADCIGCSKCITACPFDAILGSRKLMHTVIANECIGCELCIKPCPVDCIDMVAVSAPIDKKEMANLARERYQARNTRLKKILSERKAYIEEAIARVKGMTRNSR